MNDDLREALATVLFAAMVTRKGAPEIADAAISCFREYLSRPEVVERAAKGAFEADASEIDPDWADLYTAEREVWIDGARATLAAILLEKVVK